MTASPDRAALIGHLNEGLARDYQAPVAVPAPVASTCEARGRLRTDRANEVTTIRRDRIRLTESAAPSEVGIADDLREILRNEQEHVTDLATALGEDVPDVSSRRD